MFETRKKLKERAIEAEERALQHFIKLNTIEQILFVEKEKKTPAVYIVKKIEEVIVGKTNNF